MAKLLADDRSRAIVRAVADGPLQPAELERSLGIARSTLYARVGELSAVGILVARRLTSFPLRVGYGLSDAGRVVVATEVLAERQQRRRLAVETTDWSSTLADLVQLLAPASRLTSQSVGTCVLLEHNSSGPTASVWLLVDDGLIRLTEGHAKQRLPVASLAAGPAAWDETLLSGSARRLQVEGNRLLARGVVSALAATLRS